MQVRIRLHRDSHCIVNVCKPYSIVLEVELQLKKSLFRKEFLEEGNQFVMKLIKGIHQLVGLLKTQTSVR